MEFSDAEIRAILKFSFVKGKCAKESFRETNSAKESWYFITLNRGRMVLTIQSRWKRHPG